MKKIAIPVANGKLSAHFGHAPHFYIYHTDGSMIVKEELATPPPHEFGVIPNWLGEIAITDLITGGIGHKAVEIINSHNINVFTGAPEDAPQTIIKAFLSNTLQTTANMCNHDENDDHNCEH